MLKEDLQGSEKSKCHGVNQFGHLHTNFVVENIYVPIMSVILKQTNFDVCIVYDIDFSTDF